MGSRYEFLEDGAQLVATLDGMEGVCYEQAERDFRNGDAYLVLGNPSATAAVIQGTKAQIIEQLRGYIAVVEQSSPEAMDDKPRRKPTVVVIENPDEDPGWFVYGGEVDISTISSFPFSKYADEGAAREATEEWLEVLRVGTEPKEFLTWLRDWLKEELNYRHRDFEVDWDALTIVDETEEVEDVPDVERIPSSVRAALTVAAERGKRICLWLDETSYASHLDGTGFIPSIVVENEAGHSPLAPNTPLGPLYLGPTYADARRIVDAFNATIGVSHKDMLDIVMSSMAASRTT